MKKFLHNQNGSVMIIVAFGMIVFMGMAALSIDLGRAYLTKSQLQKAVDAAALAGARDLSNSATAMNTSIIYAGQNGVSIPNSIPNPISTTTGTDGPVATVTQSGDVVKVTTPYQGNTTKIKVECSKTVSYFFGKALGIGSGVVSASAVAQKVWGGDALPFLNTGKYGTASPDNQIVIWNKNWATDTGSPGYYECISDFTVGGTDPNRYFKVDWSDGVVVDNGSATNKDSRSKVISEVCQPNSTVYILSLSDYCIRTNKVWVNGTVNADGSITRNTQRTLTGDPSAKIAQSDIIDPDQLVLLECTINNFNRSQKDIYATVNAIYDLKNPVQDQNGDGVLDDYTDFPPNFTSQYGGVTKLVQ